MTAPPLNEDDGVASDEGTDDQDAKAESVLSAIEKVSLLCSTLPCRSGPSDGGLTILAASQSG